MRIIFLDTNILNNKLYDEKMQQQTVRLVYNFNILVLCFLIQAFFY